ncbi:MAG: hypothetical protein Q8K78_05810 [Planctomycetaceae bacterium]|nr:hypothetical protein [Planctomycetaceae bacterium]
MPASTHAAATPLATADPPDKSPHPSAERGPRQPEKKIGPFAGGVGVSVWLNHTDTSDGGTRTFRSITIAPRRYFDKESNQWKDAASYNPTDLPALIFALTQAQAYCYTTPLPGETSGENGEQPPF